jgi:hypothetical protein
MLALHTTDDDWTLTDQTVAAFVNYTGPYQTQFRFSLPRDLTVYEGVQYEYYRPTVSFGIKPSGRSALSVRGRFGSGVDYANSRPAASVVQVAPAVEYRPASRVSLQLSYNLDQLSVAGGRLYLANLGQLKAIYHINVRTFVRAILQYTDISRDPDLYLFAVEPRTRRFFSQYLFSFKLNPQTVIFAGYSDNSAAMQGNDLQQQNRTFFVKLGYAWAF